MPKLILASGSFSRKAMLENAGFVFDIVPADIDEKAIKNNFDGCFDALAKTLACEKAWAISKYYKDDYVIGSDQLLIFKDKILSKAHNKQDATEKLKMLRGQTHTLISSVCVVKNQQEVFSYTAQAQLTMHDFDDDFLTRYIDKAGNIVTQCVGAYALEDVGIQLFQEIKGDYFTVLGMPLLPLASFLRQEGFGL